MVNKKAIFTVAMLLIILTSLTIISATNTTDDNTHDISPQQIKETPTTHTNNTKTIHKDTTQKTTQTKKATSTVNSYSGLLTEISNAKTSTDDEYIINLEEGDYKISTPITWSGSQNTKKLTINGNGNTIDGQNSKTFLTIGKDYTIILNNITLLNCQGGASGNIKNNGNLTIINSTFKNNKASYGGIMVNEGNVVITDSFFESNSAEMDGGIIYNPGGNYDITMKLTNSKFIKNTARNGGVIASIEAYPLDLEINHCEFDQNKASDYGSAIAVADEEMEGPNRIKVSSTDSIFTNNSAGHRATIYIGELTANFKNCTFIDNKVSARGGAIYNYFSQYSFTDSKFINNTQTGEEDNYAGAAIYHYDNQYLSTIDNCTFTNNNASGKKGGAAIYSYGMIDINNSIFNNNYAKTGEIIYTQDTLSINNTSFSNNNASGGIIKNVDKLVVNNSNFTENEGGITAGIYSRSNCNVSNTRFVKNKGMNTGSIYIYSGNSIIQNSSFINNTAQECGGGITIHEADVLLNNSLFENNEATDPELGFGGAIAIEENSNVNITNSNFTKNKADFSSAISNEGTTNISFSKFYLNTGKDIGAIENKGNLYLYDSELSNNTAKDGGAIYNKKNLTIENSNFTKNSAADNGGAIYSVSDSTINLKNTNFTENNATTGGSVLILTSSYILTDNTFRNNTPENFGLIEDQGREIIKIINSDAYLKEPEYEVEIKINYISQGTYGCYNGLFDEYDITEKDCTYTLIMTNPNNETKFKDNTYFYYIPKMNTTTNIMEKNNVLGNVSIKVNVTDKMDKLVENGFVTVYDENNNLLGAAPLGSGAITIPLNIKEKGTYTINVSYWGNEIYNPSNKTDTLTVIPETMIEIDILNNTEGNVTIKVNATEKDGTPLKQQEINITLPNGTQITEKTDDNGIITVTDTTVESGERSVEATIEDSDDLMGSTKSKDLTVIPDYQKIIDEMNETIQDLNGTVQEQNQTIREQNQTIQDQNKTINDLNNKIKELNNTIKELNEEINLLQNEIDKLNELIDSWNKTTVIRAVPENNTVGETKVVVILDNKLENPITNAQITIKNKSGETIGIGKTDNKGIAVIPVDTLPGTENITAIYAGNNKYTANNTTVSITTYKINTTLTVEPISGIIGEDIKLIAHIKDANNNLVSGGNLVFKLNGKTLRTDGSFNSTAPAWKFKVNNGLVTITINADLYLRNAKNLTASYSGSYKYNEAKSDVVTAQIKKRDAKIAVTATPSKQKQYKTITFTAKLSDTTPNYKNKTMMHTGTKVLFKVNGKTIKDKNGANLLVKVNSNNTASYKYTVPQGMGGVTNDGNVRDYNVEAVLVSDIYYPDTRGTTKFNVERSPITIGISKVTVNSKNQLSVQASIKDYKNNYVIGTNNVNIKINGRSYVNAKTNKTQNFKVSGGKINLSKLQINKSIKIKSVMIVTGARQAYLGQRNETSKIVKV